MMKIILFFTGLLIVSGIRAQQPPDDFFRALDHIGKNNAQAKIELLSALQADSAFHGIWHFLGVIYMQEHKPDTAITCFRRSIELNGNNVNHTREMTVVRLIRAYLTGLDFTHAYRIAWQATNEFPDNKFILMNLRDCCLWAYSIRVNVLDSAYLSNTDVRDEYIVKNISEEYLILRNIRINDTGLSMISQSLVKKKGRNYDVLECSVPGAGSKVALNFRLDWDMKKYFGGVTLNTDETYNNTGNPVYLRIGALMAKDGNTDIVQAIRDIEKP